MEESSNLIFLQPIKKEQFKKQLLSKQRKILRRLFKITFIMLSIADTISSPAYAKDLKSKKKLPKLLVKLKNQTKVLAKFFGEVTINKPMTFLSFVAMMCNSYNGIAVPIFTIGYIGCVVGWFFSLYH